MGVWVEKSVSMYHDLEERGSCSIILRCLLIELHSV